MKFMKLHYLYLRRLVVMNLDTLERRLSRYRRFQNGDYWSVDFQEKIALLETEMKAMEEIKEYLDTEISLLSLR